MKRKTVSLNKSIRLVFGVAVLLLFITWTRFGLQVVAVESQWVFLIFYCCHVFGLPLFFVRLG